MMTKLFVMYREKHTVIATMAYFRKSLGKYLLKYLLEKKSQLVYYPTQTTITKYHRLGTLQQQKFTSQSLLLRNLLILPWRLRSPRSRCQHGQFLVRVLAVGCLLSVALHGGKRELSGVSSSSYELPALLD